MNLTIEEIAAGTPLEVINSDGEVVALFARGKPETPKKRTPKPKSQFSDGGFVMNGQQALIHISADTDTFPKSVRLRVYMRLMGILDYENEILLNQKEVAKQLHISQSQMCRAVKTLVQAKYVLIGERHQGTCKSYRLNPCVAWRGSQASHKKALDELSGDDRMEFAKVINLADRKAERGE